MNRAATESPSAINSCYLFSDADPLFPFGHGLSYTTFDYGNLTVDPPTITIDGEADVTVEVTNVGDRSAEEVGQCYVRDRLASVTRPERSLRVRAGRARTWRDQDDHAWVRETWLWSIVI